MEHNIHQSESLGYGPKRDYFLPVSILVSGVVIAAAVIFASLYRGGSTTVQAGDPQGAQPVANADTIMKLNPNDVVLGKADAKVTVIEYGDYQCPFCSRFFSQTQPLLVANYVNTGKIKLVFRNFMVNDRSANDHESHNSALAAECAKDQGKFWEFHDALYSIEVKDETKNPQTAENNGNLNRALFLATAQSTGMNIADFTSCYDSGKYATQVQNDSDVASANQISATPTFFVNGKVISGAQPYSVFQTAIEAAGK